MGSLTFLLALLGCFILLVSYTLRSRHTDSPSLTPNNIIKVCWLTRTKEAPSSTLVTSQNLFRFGISPKSTIILVVALNPPPFVINVDSSPTRSNEDDVTSSGGKRKRR
ncbi:unnamed protein product [Ilex paraguariensis]|uniref:ATP synthase F0 subunit 8 n=1 Tax=Ilex paraguariensis TaxID=185542 RepID=A0ABC8TGT3_9AQUA